MTADVSAGKLSAGYAHRNPGVASYAGILRTADHARRETWRCKHDHATTYSAKLCSDAELERRRQGARTVRGVKYCPGCDVYYGPEGQLTQLGFGVLADDTCPRCFIPVLEYTIVVQP